jgi:ligand-binding sensor domain-containing protein/PKD repeat protein
VLSASLNGQEARQYTFTHYTSSSGLISNQVNTVVQDEDGFIWIGTTDGLQRFDGIRYKTFRHDDNDISSLPSKSVIQLLIDSKKNLWVLNADGNVGIFNTKKFIYREAAVKFKTKLSLRTVSKRLIKDEYGNIFFLLAGRELITWNEKNNEFSFAHNFFLQNKEWGIADFAQQPGTQKYWISIQGAGIAVYDQAANKLSYAGNNVENERAIEQFEKKISAYNFFFDKQHRLWFNTLGSGFQYTYSYDLKKHEFILNEYEFYSFFKTYYEGLGFFEQQDGSIWIKGSKVFARYLEKEKKFEHVSDIYKNETDISYRIITDLFEDRERNIWVGTGNNGLFRFNPAEELFTNIKHISRSTGIEGDGGAISFIRDTDGSMLIGHWGDGLYRYDKNFKPIPVSIKGIDDNNLISIWDMDYSKDSQIIWMSAQPGVYIYNTKSRSAAFYNPPVLQNKTVREIAEDKKGNLWLGMQAIGVFKWDAVKGKSKFEEGLSKFMSIPDVQVNKILVDKMGFVWIATAGKGSYVIDPITDKVLMHFHKEATDEKKLSEEGVSSFFEYDDSLMVITTATRAFIYNRILKKMSLLAGSNIFSGYISSIEKDGTGNLWISTNSALYRVNINKKVFISFNRSDGIYNDYFVLSSSYTLPDARMLFGSSGQFIVFNPASVHINTTEFPKVVITDFKVKNKYMQVDSLRQLKKIELSHDENSVEIEFSYLKYIKNHVIKYKLEGLDKDWKIADESNQAVYSYLPPGTYTFLLTTINAEATTGKNITQLIIKINPPFWKTWWFFCLLALVVVAVIYWLDRQRINKLIALHKVRIEIAGNLHEEVNTTLNNINLLSEMARIKADKEIDRSKEYIEQISHKSRKMINAMSDILWTIDPQNDNMEKSLLRMMEFADALRNRYDVHIEIALDKKVRSLKLDMNTRHESYLIFKEALWMIVKYSGGKETFIYIDLFKNKLSMKLQDATAKLDKNITEIENSIKEINTRSGLIGADLDVQYEKNGIAVILLVPVK